MVLLLFIYKMFIHVKVMCSYVTKATHKSYATELKDIVNISYEVTCFLHDISDTLPICLATTTTQPFLGFPTNKADSNDIIIDSPLPPVVCRRVHVLFTLFVFVCVQWCPTHIILCFWFVFLVYPMLPVSLDCAVLIASAVFSNVYETERLLKMVLDISISNHDISKF